MNDTGSIFIKWFHQKKASNIRKAGMITCSSSIVIYTAMYLNPPGIVSTVLFPVGFFLAVISPFILLGDFARYYNNEKQARRFS